MLIGVPKEIKPDEYRVAITPSGVEQFVSRGHRVLIERGAGLGSGIPDDEYKTQGAIIVDTHEEVFERADMILKVKEPLPEEYALLREEQIVFTYFHFAASQELTESILKSKIIAIAYETVEEDDGSLPLLIPMSEIAGRMAPQEGAKYLEKPHGGIGILLGGVPGVPPAKVVIIGAGTVGCNALRVALGMGADVTVLDTNPNKLRYISEIYPEAKTLISNPYNIRAVIRDADLVIIGILITGARAPKLITKEMLKEMKPGSVIVDVSIDQGGGTETSRPTTHKNPVYEVDGVIHYCVANMPGAVPRTSTFALTNVTLPYALEIADLGWKEAARKKSSIKKGVNMVKGFLTYDKIAEAFSLNYTPIDELIY